MNPKTCIDSKDLSEGLVEYENYIEALMVCLIGVMVCSRELDDEDPSLGMFIVGCSTRIREDGGFSCFLNQEVGRSP